MRSFFFTLRALPRWLAAARTACVTASLSLLSLGATQTPALAAPAAAGPAQAATHPASRPLPAGANRLAGAAATGVVPNGTYQLLARHSGKALDVANGSTTDGGKVQQWAAYPATANNPNQQWVVELQADGSYKLTHKGTSQVLDVKGGSSADGAVVQQYTDNGSPAQRWVLTSTDNGYYTLKHQGTSKVLDVPASSTADGVGLIQYEAKTQDNYNQQWQFVRLDAAAPVSGGVYELVARHSGKALDVDNNSAADQAKVQQYTRNQSPAQQWRLDLQADGTYSLTHQGTSKVLDLAGNNPADGTTIWQYGDNKSDAQRWSLVATDNGYYKLLHKGTNQSVSVIGGETATQNAVGIELRAYAGGKNQQWQLNLVSNPTTPPPPAGRLALVGVNLASGGFAPEKPLDGYYEYPSFDDVDYYARKGLNIFRLSFLWERLQNQQYGPLGGKGFNGKSDLAIIDDLVNYAASKNIKTILDPHNFGKWMGNDIGSSSVPVSAFTDFWSKLAGHYKNNPNVIFGIMNEPGNFNNDDHPWLPISNAAIKAIRDAGATTQTIFVGGAFYNNANEWTWASNGNTTAKGVGLGTIDPNNNYVLEAHCYYDANGGGGTPGAVSATIGVERIKAVTEWARANGKKMFLGEFGASKDDLCLQAMDNQLAYMQANSDVWVGGTYWAGGPGWGDDFLSIEPLPDVKTGPDKPQMGVLSKYAPNQPAAARVAATALAAPTTTAVAGSALQAYPNPTRGQATLALSAATAQRVAVQVYNQQGTLVSRFTVPAQAGRTDVAVPATLLPGTYHLQATVDGRAQRFTLRVE